jgi:xanthine dehydrogenase YagR molybdenum-binding subunit
VGSGGSQTTSSVTPAVRKAAEQVKAELAELAARKLGTSVGKLGWDDEGGCGDGKAALRFEQICQLMDDEPLTATAQRPGTYGAHPMKFMGGMRYQMAGVQFAEVEVDTWTGEVRVLEMVAVHDPGRVMNPLTLRSQINGGVIMGTGMALCEQRFMDRRTGRVLNANLEGYKLPGVSDIPDIKVILTEVHTGANNTGAIGIGEPATIPTAAAIANAVFDAVGEPVRSLPLTPDRVLAAIELFEQGGAA